MSVKQCLIYCIIADSLFQVFFGTPQRVKDVAAWEDTIYRLFVATATTKTSPSLLQKARVVSKTLWQVATDFQGHIANHGLVNIYQDTGVDDQSGRLTAPQQDIEFDQVVDSFTATTDLVNEVKIGRNRDHRDLCKFDKADEQFRAVLNALKIGISA